MNEAENNVLSIMLIYQEKQTYIFEKCREEIDRLNLIDQKMRQLEEELEELVGIPDNKNSNKLDWLS